MRNYLSRLLELIPVSWRLPLIVGLALLLLLGAVFYGRRAANKLSGWVYDRTTASKRHEIDEALKEAEASKKVAADALAALAAEKKVTEEERKKREQLEKLLGDSRKTTDQKLKEYQDSLSRAPTVTGPQSTDELCARAASLGIACQ